ncbi:MAG: hypothetical protein ACRC3B_14680 [Bacteroidia bacterium]
MKQAGLALSAFLVLVFSCKAQTVAADFSYNYMYSGQWDKAIQTYNFSRPFLSQKQPVLMHGANASLAYLFQSDRKVKQGIGLSYSFFRSTAENDNFLNALNLHLLNLSYIFHVECSGKMSGFYSDILFSATAGTLNRRINGEPLLVDESRAKALSIGGSINLKSGYYLKPKNRTTLSPFIAVGFCPYLYAPNAEGVINQTQELSGKEWTMLLTVQAGLGIYFNRTVK